MEQPATPKSGGVPAGDLEMAAARLDAYGRAVRASLVHREGPSRPPVLRLSDEQLAALFAPRQLDSLVVRPLGRAPVECAD